MALLELVPKLSESIGDATFGYCDIETTGLFLNEGGRPHRIVEVAAVLTDCRGRVLDALSSLVNPERSIPPEASGVHGLRDADVATAPRWGEVQAPLLEFLSRASIVFGYNSPFDLRFIVHEMLLQEISPPRMEFYDVARMASRAGFGRCSLLDLVNLLGDGAIRHRPEHHVRTDGGVRKGRASPVSLLPARRIEGQALPRSRSEHSSHRALGDAERTATCMTALLAQGFGTDEPLAALKETHDATVPVYDAARCLAGIEAASRKRRRRYSSRAPRKPKPSLPLVCVTGKLDGMLRAEVKRRLAAVGFRYVSEASRQPEFVVVGERPADRKVRDAMLAGIPVMNGRRFMEWLKAREGPCARGA